ncbi:HPr kinase/phosphorylase [Jannaschia marina]|uniref:HPr kinase/phosphorylase n=1 Tax=Jannaschia marina TaxID=2741674 RepID=UPI0015C86957|nr:hypothetical protein [Jannaschia marina]
MAETFPRPNRLPGGGVSLHATTVALDGRALAICGPSGAGKSETAAQMIALGAVLVSDDLTLLRREGSSLRASAPAGAPAALETRGIGLIALPLAPPAVLAGLLWLGPSPARLPEPEAQEIEGVAVPLLRHPVRPALAAKAVLWLRAATA